MKSAYIHIPFCEHICHYCDFNKYFIQSQPVDGYLNALEQEMINTIAKTGQPDLKTIFIGGGTPTSLSEEQAQKADGYDQPCAEALKRLIGICG